MICPVEIASGSVRFSGGVPLATVERVLGLYRDRYFDLNVRHFHEKLGAEHGIQLSHTSVKQALQGAGLVAKGRKRGVHRKRRERRPLPAMLLHIDGHLDGSISLTHGPHRLGRPTEARSSLPWT